MSNIEEWKPVLGYEGRYEVSSFGRLKNRKGYIYNINPREGHYVNTSLSIDGIKRSFRMHTLVLTSFSGIRPWGKEASHLDGDRSNNNIYNLKWETHQENVSRQLDHGTRNRGERSGSSVLTNIDVLEIRKLHKEGVFNQREIAKMFSIGYKAINKIVLRQRWSHI